MRRKYFNSFPEKIEQVEAEFNGKKSMRFRYNGDRRRYRTRKVLRSRKENL